MMNRVRQFLSDLLSRVSFWLSELADRIEPPAPPRKLSAFEQVYRDEWLAVCARDEDALLKGDGS